MSSGTQPTTAIDCLPKAPTFTMQPGPCVQQLLDAGYDAPLPADQALMDTSNQTQTARAAVRPKRFKSSPSDRFALVTAHHEHSHQLTEKESKAKLSRQQIRNVRDRTLEDLHQLAPHLPTMMTNWKEFDSLKKPTDTMYTAAKKSENTSGSDRHKTSDMEVYQLMLPHKLRSAQAEKPAMLHMDSIASEWAVPLLCASLPSLTGKHDTLSPVYRACSNGAEEICSCCQ